MTKTFIYLIIFSLSTVPTLFAKEAHVHGAAKLNIAANGKEMLIEFSSPLYNIVGFEYAPTTQEEKDLIENAKKKLEMINFHFSDKCRKKNTTFEMEEEHDEDGHEDDDHYDEDEHNEILVNYFFECQKELSSLDLKDFFSEFKNLEDVDASWALKSGQGFQEANRKKSKVTFSR